MTLPFPRRPRRSAASLFGFAFAPFLAAAAPANPPGNGRAHAPATWRRSPASETCDDADHEARAASPPARRGDRGRSSPNVKLTVEARTTHGPWRMRLTNDGDVPVRIVADARLLSLEVTPRSARKAVRCELPEDMRPDDDLAGTLVLPPKRSYAETFEPRLLCFTAAQREALVPGAIVVAHLGWTKPSARPPFEVSPIDGVEPMSAPMRLVSAPAIAVPDEPTAAPASLERPGMPGDPDPPKLRLMASPAIDAMSPSGIEVTVHLHNDGARPVVVRFRPENLGFDVTSARGIERCAWPMQPTAAMRSLFATVSPHGSTEILGIAGRLLQWPRLRPCGPLGGATLPRHAESIRRGHRSADV